MTPPRIIVICGGRRVGKDTIARHLVLAHSYIPFRFSEPIYAAVAAMTGRSIEWLMDNKNARLPMFGGNTVRTVLQTLGTEWGRDIIYEDIWVERLRAVVSAYVPERFVISDCRFLNEYDAMVDFAHRHGSDCALIRVVRPNSAIPPEEQDGTDTHASELSICSLQPDVTFYNTSDIPTLKFIVDGWLNSFVKEALI